MKTKTTRNLVISALTCALYVVLTMPFASFSFGIIQFRLSDILAVLPFFTPAAIPGLFLGCAISNLVSSFGIFDVIFGSLATLIAAILTNKSKNAFVATIWPVLSNGIIIGAMITILETGKFFTKVLLINMLYISISEFIVCVLLGNLLILLIEKTKINKILRG